jgi:integrase
VHRTPRDKRLYWRGGKLWCRVPGPGGRIVRKATRCTHEAAATRRADELERRFADPRHAAAAAATLEGSVRALLDDMRRRGLAHATRAIASQKLGHFLRVWGMQFPMVEIGPQPVLDYIDARQREWVTRFTIAKELAHLGQMLKLARYLGVYHRDPVEVLPPFFHGDHKPRGRKLTAAEFEALLWEFTDRRAAHLCFIVATGARKSEAVKARRRDIFPEHVHLHGTKTLLADDDVPITPISRPWLERAMRDAPGKDVLFAPWGNLARDVGAACVRVGIARVTPNDLRRTFGSWHRDAGVSAELVSKLLRHTTDKLAQTTYAKLQASAVGKLISACLEGSAVGSKTVSDLYQNRESSDPKEPEEDHEPAGNTSAPEMSRTSDFRFRKPIATRASRGTKLGIERARQNRAVLGLYPTSDSADLSAAALRGDSRSRAFRAKAWSWFAGQRRAA